MKKTFVAIAIALAMTSGVQAQRFVLENNELMDVDSGYARGVLWDNSVANILAGGSISDTFLNNAATLNVLESSLNNVFAYDFSTVNIAVGGQVSQLNAYGSGEVYVTGPAGTINSYDYRKVHVLADGQVSNLTARGFSRVEVADGGSVGSLNSQVYSDINILAGGTVNSLSVGSYSRATIESGGEAGSVQTSGDSRTHISALGQVNSVQSSDTSLVTMSATTGISSVQATGSSTIEIAGATEISSLTAVHESTINIASATEIGSIEVADIATVNISASSQIGSLQAGNFSRVNIFDGEVISLSALDNSEVTIFGHDFRATHGLVLNGNEVIGTGVLTGKSFSQDDTRWTITINSNSSGSSLKVATQVPAIINLETNPEQAGVIVGEGIYQLGAEATIAARTLPGYDFVGWTEGGQTVSTDPEYSFTVVGSRQLTANFSHRFAGGSGTPDDPWTISTREQLETINDFLDLPAYYSLLNDLDLAGKTYEQAIVAATLEEPFIGQFDGGGRVIHNFRIAQNNSDYTGLFGVVGETGEIRHLGIANVELSGHNYVGGLAGLNQGLIEQCYAVDWNNLFPQLFHPADIDHDWRVSMSEAISYLTGWQLGSNPMSWAIRAAYIWQNGEAYQYNHNLEPPMHWQPLTEKIAATKNEQGDEHPPISGDQSVGGLVGLNSETGNIFDSFAIIPVRGTAAVGGLCGENRGGIAFVYAAGPVLATDQAGGLMGANQGTVANGFWDIQSSGMAESAAGQGRNSKEMKTAATFIEDGWDFNQVWKMTSLSSEFHGYPEFIEAGQIYYIVTVNVDPAPAGQALETGSHLADTEATVRAEPGEGYAFVNWTEDGEPVSTEIEYTFVPTSNHELIANFALRLRYLASPGGILEGEPEQQVAVGGSGSEILAVPNEGFHFVRWTDGSTENPRTDTEVEVPLEVVALFAANLELRYEATNGGRVDGELVQSVAPGESGTEVEAIPDPGHLFVEWSDGITDNPRTDSEVTQSIEVQAVFEPEAEWISPATGMEFVWIEDLQMWVGRFEVTNQQYRVKQANHNSGLYRGFSLDNSRQPVVQVNFDDAREYAEWLTGVERTVVLPDPNGGGETISLLPQGYSYRLLSRDEWTTIARVGDQRKYPWGNSWPPPIGRAGNYADTAYGNAFGALHLQTYSDGFIVSAPAIAGAGNDDEDGNGGGGGGGTWRNPWGLYGVGGNVMEITTDVPNGSFDAWRGGSWRCRSSTDMEITYRYRAGSSSREYENRGFRLVLAR